MIQNIYFKECEQPILNTHWYNLSCNQTTDYLIAKFVRLHKFQIRSISITPHKLINGLQYYLEDLGAPTEDLYTSRLVLACKMYFVPKC